MARLPHSAQRKTSIRYEYHVVAGRAVTFPQHGWHYCSKSEGQVYMYLSCFDRLGVVCESSLIGINKCFCFMTWSGLYVDRMYFGYKSDREVASLLFCSLYKPSEMKRRGTRTHFSLCIMSHFEFLKVITCSSSRRLFVTNICVSHDGDNGTEDYVRFRPVK